MLRCWFTNVTLPDDSNRAVDILVCCTQNTKGVPSNRSQSLAFMSTTLLHHIPYQITLGTPWTGQPASSTATNTSPAGSPSRWPTFLMNMPWVIIFWCFWWLWSRRAVLQSLVLFVAESTASSHMHTFITGNFPACILSTQVTFSHAYFCHRWLSHTFFKVAISPSPGKYLMYLKTSPTCAGDSQYLWPSIIWCQRFVQNGHARLFPNICHLKCGFSGQLDCADAWAGNQCRGRIWGLKLRLFKNV